MTVPYWKRFSPAVPVSSSYDYINSDVLLHHASVSANQLTLDGGMSYRVLVIPDEMTSLSLPMVRKLGELIKAGAIVIAPRIANTPSSFRISLTSPELKTLANDIWGANPTPSGSRSYGQGKVYWGTSLEQVLSDEGTAPDFTFGSAKDRFDL